MERCRDCYGNRRAEHRAKSGANRHQGRWEGRNLNATFTELRRTGQEAAKTELFEARAARHYARQHAGPAGRNLTDLNLPVLRANYVCSENSWHAGYGLYVTNLLRGVNFLPYDHTRTGQ